MTYYVPRIWSLVLSALLKEIALIFIRRLFNPIIVSCTYCQYTIMNPNNSQNESKLDKDSGSLTCDLCEQTFDTMESFKEHKAAENNDEGLKYRGID